MPKKILAIIGGTYIFGLEKVSIDVLEGLKKKGHTLHCMVSGWNDGDFIKQLNTIQIPYTAIKLGWYYITKLLWSLDSLVHYPKAIIDFINLKRRIKPELIYIYSYRQIMLLYPFFNNNIIYHVQDPNAESKQARFFLKMIDKKVKSYIAPSNYIKEDLIKCGIAANKIQLIYNGTEILPAIDEEANEKFTIGIIGQIIERKGHLQLIEALHILHQKNIFVYLKILILKIWF